MSLACGDEAPGELLRGIEQFNRGEYYECHETLEALWLAEPSYVRQLYQGVLQVGVGLLHLLRGNYRGAVALLERGLERLRRLDAACLGVDVAGLIQEAEACRWELLGLGPNGMKEFDRTLLPQIRVASPPRVASACPPSSGPSQ